MITAVALSPALDVTYVVDEVTLGRIHRPIETYKMAGGKALNASRAAALLGADVAVVATLGGGTGATVAEGIREAGVSLTAVSTRARTRTCVSLFSSQSGSLTELYERPSEVSPDEWIAVLTSVRDLVRRRPGWMMICGGNPETLPSNALEQLVSSAQSAGLRVALDSYGPRMAQAIASAPIDLVKVNRFEAAALLGRSENANIAALAAELQGVTRGLVVLTDGAEGSVAADGAVLIRARLREPVGQFAVGSGDSFLGGLVVALDSGTTLASAMRLAAACGTANALVPGAARFSREGAEALVADVEIISAQP